jgi:hypothetical protein
LALIEQLTQHWQRIVRRRSHYRHVFLNTGLSGSIVLADLRRFCKAGEPPLVLNAQQQTDVYATGMAAGRQEVFWRIAHHLHLDDAKLLELKEQLEND